MIKEVKIPNLWGKNVFAGIPPEDMPKDIAEFWHALAIELADMMRAVANAKEGQVVLNDYRKAGDQYIWEFYVNDLAKDRVPTQVNWHGQNTSQWLYAGGLLLDHGKISLHH